MTTVNWGIDVNIWVAFDLLAHTSVIFGYAPPLPPVKTRGHQKCYEKMAFDICGFDHQKYYKTSFGFLRDVLPCVLRDILTCFLRGVLPCVLGREGWARNKIEPGVLSIGHVLWRSEIIRFKRAQHPTMSELFMRQ